MSTKNDMVSRSNFSEDHAKEFALAMSIAKKNADAFARHNSRSWLAAIKVGSIEQGDIEEEKEMQKLKDIFGNPTGVKENRTEILHITQVMQLLQKKFANRGTQLEDLKAQIDNILNFLKSEIPLPKKLENSNINTLTVYYRKKEVKRFGLTIALVDQKFVITEVKGYSSRIVGIVPGLILYDVFVEKTQVQGNTPTDLAAKMTRGLQQGDVKLRFAAVEKSSASAFQSKCYKSK